MNPSMKQSQLNIEKEIRMSLNFVLSSPKRARSVALWRFNLEPKIVKLVYNTHVSCIYPDDMKNKAT